MVKVLILLETRGGGFSPHVRQLKANRNHVIFHVITLYLIFPEAVIVVLPL